MYRQIILFLTLIWPALLFAEDTILQYYRPFTETNKQPPIMIVANKAGECWQQSQHVLREDAWRCVSEGRVYDPCFVKPVGSHLEAVCPDSPWSGKSVQITVVTPLDNSHHSPLDMSRNYAWAIELGDGEKCLAVDAGENQGGLPVRYHCDRQTVLVGHIQRCAAAWKMLQYNPAGITTAVITKAWF